MKLAIVGSTGMLGQALVSEAACLGHDVVGIARSNADICVDISDDIRLGQALEAISPDAVINAAAQTNLAACEQDPGRAYLVNARAVAVMAEACSLAGTYFVQVSTDHYFVNDGDGKHGEDERVHLVNEYARSKYAGEAFALTCQGALVVRTNIVGFRRRGSPTFAEWAIEALQSGEPVTLFEDFYTSSIHVNGFAEALFALLPLRPAGVLNLAARTVCSKKVFVEMLADELGLSTRATVAGSVKSHAGARRADSLGLDVGKAERLLGRELPTISRVVSALADEYRRMSHEV